MQMGAAMLSTTAIARAGGPATSPTTAPTTQSGDDLRWMDTRDLRIEGRGWSDVGFGRLPERFKADLRPPVWDLSRHSAGLCLRFRSDSARLVVHYTLTSDVLAMPHMPATGVSGFDLYGLTRREWRWRWLSVTRPKEQTGAIDLLSGIDHDERVYQLYFPLYNGVKSLEIGVDRGAEFELLPAPKQRVVYYGTSIAQGGCASRPGMAHVAILGRRLDVEMINLGFSGQGRLDLPIADAMSEIDAAVYVVDCLPNCTTDIVNERGHAFLRRLHTARPTTPIVVVGDPDWCHAFASSPTRAAQQPRRVAMQQACTRAVAAGARCAWHPIDDAFAPDYEGTVDGVHPNDLGMSQLANAIAPAIERALGKAGGR